MIVLFINLLILGPYICNSIPNNYGTVALIEYHDDHHHHHHETLESFANDIEMVPSVLSERASKTSEINKALNYYEYEPIVTYDRQKYNPQIEKYEYYYESSFGPMESEIEYEPIEIKYEDEHKYDLVSSLEDHDDLDEHEIESHDDDTLPHEYEPVIDLDLHNREDEHEDYYDMPDQKPGYGKKHSKYNEKKQKKQKNPYKPHDEYKMNDVLFSSKSKDEERMNLDDHNSDKKRLNLEISAH